MLYIKGRQKSPEDLLVFAMGSTMPEYSGLKQQYLLSSPFWVGDVGWAQLVSSSHGSSCAQSAFVIIRQGLQLGLADCGQGHQQQRGWGHVCLLTQQASRGWSRGRGSGNPQSSDAPAGWCFSVSVSAMFAPMHVHKQLSIKITQTRVLPRWLSDKESPANTGDAKDMGSIPGSGSSPGEGNGNPL